MPKHQVSLQDHLGYVGGCQNSGPFLGPLNIRCRIMLSTQTGTTILTTTHVFLTGLLRALARC